MKTSTKLQEAMAMGQAVYSQQQSDPSADPGAGGPSAGAGPASDDNVVDAEFKDSNDTNAK